MSRSDELFDIDAARAHADAVRLFVEQEQAHLIGNSAEPFTLSGSAEVASVNRASSCKAPVYRSNWARLGFYFCAASWAIKNAALLLKCRYLLTLEACRAKIFASAQRVSRANNGPRVVSFMKLNLLPVSRLAFEVSHHLAIRMNRCEHGLKLRLLTVRLEQGDMHILYLELQLWRNLLLVQQRPDCDTGIGGAFEASADASGDVHRTEDYAQVHSEGSA